MTMAAAAGTCYCEMEVERDDDGRRKRIREQLDPDLCGKPAAWYTLSGQLASVKAKLCNLHAELLRRRGLAVTVATE